MHVTDHRISLKIEWKMIEQYVDVTDHSTSLQIEWKMTPKIDGKWMIEC